MSDVTSEEIMEGPLEGSYSALAALLLVQRGQQVIDLFQVGHHLGEVVTVIGLEFPLTALLYAVVLVTPFV